MRNFRVIGLLKTGETTTDVEHPLLNANHRRILDCKSMLNRTLAKDENAIIYVAEDSDSVYATLPNGTTSHF